MTHGALKEQLQRAFDDRELRLHYQPKFHLASGELRGAEALLRWQTPAGMWISPATFVPLLEETGLICEVGAWLFERAAADALWWRERGLDVGRIAINVSPLQLQRCDFLGWLKSIRPQWDTCGTGLDIELTESHLLPDPGGLAEAMSALVESNVRFALDDFGVGYSSLDLLMKLPVRYLKIDRSFVAGLPTGRRAVSLVESVIHLAHELGIEAIAEGVETAEQLACLRELGCDIGQGYYFFPALSRVALLHMLASAPSHVAPARLDAFPAHCYDRSTYGTSQLPQPAVRVAGDPPLCAPLGIR